VKLLLKRNGSDAEGTAKFVAQARAQVTARNLYYAGVAALVLVNVFLLAQIGVAWHRASVNNADAFAQQQVQLKTAALAAKPLQGLDAKLEDARGQANAFYLRRLPYSYAQVAAELGVLTKRTTVKLTGINYAPMLVMSDGELTELNMDARLSGDYRSLMQFINALERDQQFFLIDGITLTGAQSGSVNLRLRLTTYLRAPANEDELKRVTALPASETAPADGGGR
jgi:Tfp pilus assembly protein PilO